MEKLSVLSICVGYVAVFSIETFNLEIAFFNEFNYLLVRLRRPQLK